MTTFQVLWNLIQIENQMQNDLDKQSLNSIPTFLQNISNLLGRINLNKHEKEVEKIQLIQILIKTLPKISELIEFLKVTHAFNI